jgi:cytochrome P450
VSVPFLDPQAPGFSIRSPQVLAARQQHWYARTPFGVAILRYEDANELQNDKRLYQGTRRWPELNGITTGPLAQWWPDMMMSLEGQDHLRLRKLANPAFKPRLIEALTPQFTALADELTSVFANRGHTEFMTEFAEPYSARVIARLLGMDESLWPQLAHCATQMGYVFSVTVKDDLPKIEQGLAGILELSEALIRRRRHDIRDDVISALVQASVDGEQITQRELLLMVSFLIFAGFDTTRNQLGLAMQTFADHQDQWRLLGEHPELGRAAVEEVMRVNPTITWFSREVNTAFRYKDLDSGRQRPAALPSAGL